MGKHDEIRKALAEFAGRYAPQATMLGYVVSVDPAEFTCVLKDDTDDDDDLAVHDVRLRPVIDGEESVTLFPKVGTWALAIRLESSEEWMVIAAGETDKIRMKTGNLIFEMEDLFLFQKNDETLKKIMKDLLAQIKLITVQTNSGPSSVPINKAAFTAIENRIDNFLK